MTNKQRAFCEAYLVTLNASDAARQAGYKEKSAAQMGSENLRKPEIVEYIHTRLRTIAHTADLEETMAFMTKVMRGEVKDQFGLDASIADRLRAAEGLQKRYTAVEEKSEGRKTRTLTVELGQRWEEYSE